MHTISNASPCEVPGSRVEQTPALPSGQDRYFPATRECQLPALAMSSYSSATSTGSDEPNATIGDSYLRHDLASAHDDPLLEDVFAEMAMAIVRDAMPQVDNDVGVLRTSMQHEYTIGSFLVPTACSFEPEERLLPMHNVGRVITENIMAGGKVANDTKSHVQQSVTEFMAVVITEAAVHAHEIASASRETSTGSILITPSHLRSAIEGLGLDFMFPALDQLVINNQMYGSPILPSKRDRSV